MKIYKSPIQYVNMAHKNDNEKICAALSYLIVGII